MKDVPTTESFRHLYSSLFLILMLILLISFAFSPDFSLSALLTEFRWRRSLINLYASLRLNLGDRVFSNAIIGKDGWIFYADEASIQDYQNSNPLRKKTLLSFQERLGQLSNDLEKNGILLLIVIPPNKSTIYPQYMPDEIPVLGDKSRLDQFIEQMNIDGGINVIDLRPALLEASRNQDVYFKIDTHWNDIGAYYGYYEIIKFLSEYDSRLTPYSLSDYEYSYQGDLVNPDLPRVLGIPPLMEEYWTLTLEFPSQKTQTKRLNLTNGGHISKMIGQNDQLPSLLVFHDSFYSARSSLSHFMEPHFREITGVLFNSDQGIWSLDWIQQEKPDIVIIELVERNFDVGLNLLLESVGQ